MMEASSEVNIMSDLTGGPLSPLSPLSPDVPGIPCKDDNKKLLKHDKMHRSNSNLNSDSKPTKQNMN